MGFIESTRSFENSGFGLIITLCVHAARLRSLRQWRISRVLPVCEKSIFCSGEIKRNGGPQAYRATPAEKATWDRASLPRTCKLVENRAMARLVAKKLKEFWPPEQIAGWLRRTYPDDENNQVSHETIYRSLFIQALGALKTELLHYLRTQRRMRKPRQTSLKGKVLGDIADTVSIRERPATVDDRALPGHWEGDLISGGNNSLIATLVKRHTRYVMLATVDSKDTETVIQALINHAHKLPRELYKLLTWDRGKELAECKHFTLATNVKVYVCDPQSPWQGGSNENTNGLLRQYLPEGTGLSVH